MMNSELRTRQMRRKQVNILRVIAGLLVFVTLLLSLYVIYNVIRYNMFNFKRVNYILCGTLVVVNVFLISLFLSHRAIKTITVVSFITTIVLGYSSLTLANGVGLFSVKKTTKTATMSVVVLADSNVTSVKQLSTVSAPLQEDNHNIQALLKDVANKENHTLKGESIQSYAEAYRQLMNGQVKAIVLNSSYENLLEEIDSQYASKIKKIYEMTATTTVNHQSEESRQATSSDDSRFNLYISGIDTYGSISTVSRSDVNMIMTVNTKTKQILLTTTPRDSYVRIADGGRNQYDKLTHAGIYGVEASVHTLENLYDIKVDYYARINFTTFLELIDLVGGVEVNNPAPFIASNGTRFDAGNIYLTSASALTFVRERYNLPNGDADRAANQQKVIAAIVQKLTRPSNLVNAGNILSRLSASMQTNMPFETAMLLANNQLDSDKGYTVTSQALRTSGTMGLPSYAMPGYNLYMGVVNETSLNEVKSAIQNILNGN